MNNTKTKNENLDIKFKENLPVLLVDHLFMRTRLDNLILLHFFSDLPGELNEQVRMMVPKENLKQMIDILCNECDYFPKKKRTPSVEVKPVKG
jgi:hypothetical protein